MNLNPTLLQNDSDGRPALRVPRPIDIFQAQTTVGTVFTARDDADFHIEHLVASNVTSGSHSVTVYLVPASGTAALANMIIFQKTIDAHNTLTIFDRDHVGFLQPGMTLQALCSTNNSINLWGYGYDYQGIYGSN